MNIPESLEWLELGDNKLERIPSLALKNLTKLRQLDLRGNNISIVSENSLKDFGTNLKFIYLQKNKYATLQLFPFALISQIVYPKQY